MCIYGLLATTAYGLAYPVLFAVMHRSRRTRVVLVWRGHILLVKPVIGLNRWTLPGGGIHRGETAAMAAVREVAEETGIQLEPSRLVHLGDEAANVQGIRLRLTAFKAELEQEPALKLRRLELRKARWAAPGELQNLPMAPAEAALAGLIARPKKEML